MYRGLWLLLPTVLVSSLPQHHPTLGERRKKKHQELVQIERKIVKKAEIAQFGTMSGGPDDYNADGNPGRGNRFDILVKYPSPGKTYMDSIHYENRLIIHLIQTEHSWRFLSWKRLPPAKSPIHKRKHH